MLYVNDNVWIGVKFGKSIFTHLHANDHDFD